MGGSISQRRNVFFFHFIPNLNCTDLYRHLCVKRHFWKGGWSGCGKMKIYSKIWYREGVKLVVAGAYSGGGQLILRGKCLPPDFQKGNQSKEREGG